MRKGVPVLAYGERHPSTRKRFGKVSGVKLVSIAPVRVWVVASWGRFVARLEI